MIVDAKDAIAGRIATDVAKRALLGEKIDIVRYNEDMREYISAALAPAKISEIRLDKTNLRAEVIVDEDQLSLAIGKHGQNVRLASRLVGWELDIRTKEAIEAKAKEQPAAKAPLSQLEGIGEKLIENLKAAGFNAVQDLLGADIKKLLEVKGIGKVKAEKLIKQAKKLAK